MNGRIADEGAMPPVRHSARFDDDPFALDDVLVDQLLGAADDGALPATYQPLVHVLAAARGPATEAELVGELDAVALFRSEFATGGTAGRSGPARRRRRPVKVFVAVSALSAVTATGVAAATGSLPDGVQRVAAEVLSKIGITVPDGSPSRREHPTDPSPASVEISILPEETVRDDADANEETVGDAADVGPGVVDRRPGVSTPIPDDLVPGGGPESPLATIPAETPVSAGSPPFEPAIAPAEPPITAGSPPVEPANPLPSSLPDSPPSHPSGPPLDNEPGPPLDIQPGSPPDEPGPPPNIEPGPPTNIEPGRPSAASLPPSNPAGSPPGNPDPPTPLAGDSLPGPPGP